VKIKNRQQLLMFAAIGLIAFFAADKIIFTPVMNLWTSRSKEIARLKKQVADGGLLIKRENSLRGRWEQMRTNTLAANPTIAEQQLLKGIDRWSRSSRLTVTSLGQQWKHDADDYTTLQCRVEATGNMSALSQFLFDLEKDPMALKLDSVEISTRDSEGQQLSLGLQISGLVIGLQPATQ
jgi:Tfp pilus assembly protein PilO